MPVTFHIVAPCPKCETEHHLSHEVEDGAVLLTPPFFLVECSNPYCRVKFAATLRVDVERWPRARTHQAATLRLRD